MRVTKGSCSPCYISSLVAEVLFALSRPVSQAAAVAAIYDKMIMDNEELNRVEAELQRLASTKEEEISGVRNEVARLKISAK